MSEKQPLAEAKISKADVVGAKLDNRERALDGLSENLAKELVVAQKEVERLIQGLTALDKKAEVVATLQKLFQQEGKPSKRQIGRAFDRILQATPSYGELASSIQRLVTLFQANCNAETIIRNFLYTQTLRANLQGRSLRAVLDKRLGAPISDEEMKAATEAIIEKDQKRAVEKRESEKTASFEESLKEAQIDQAAREVPKEAAAEKTSE